MFTLHYGRNGIKIVVGAVSLHILILLFRIRLIPYTCDTVQLGIDGYQSVVQLLLRIVSDATDQESTIKRLSSVFAETVVVTAFEQLFLFGCQLDSLLVAKAKNQLGHSVISELARLQIQIEAHIDKFHDHWPAKIVSMPQTLT